MGKNPRLWDEFSPALYELTVSMTAKSANRTFADQQTVTFGMRKFATRGTQFTMNGRPVFLRGTLECAIFPLTGYPPTDVPSWQRIYRIIKSYGLNFIRFHSWCPPDAAFAAADLEGVMIQAEGPQANIPAGVDKQRDAFIEQELLRIIRTYGNHPSFCLMTLGNEYGGSDAVLSHWVDMLIKEDPRRLYSSASSAQITANRQFTERGRPRGVQGPGTDMDFREAYAKEDRPLIGHEIGQWTFYPNFDETKKYTGVLAAKNFDLVRDDLAAKHLLDLAPRFVQATGRHAVLLYKEEIEILMRTPGPRRLLAARPARLSRSRDRAHRGARSVLGLERFRHPGNAPAILRSYGAPVADEETHLHYRRDFRGGSRDRALRRHGPHERAAGVDHPRRKRPGSSFGLVGGAQRAHRQADVPGRHQRLPRQSPSPRETDGDGFAQGNAPSPTSGISGSIPRMRQPRPPPMC